MFRFFLYMQWDILTAGSSKLLYCLKNLVDEKGFKWLIFPDEKKVSLNEKTVVEKHKKSNKNLP